MRYLLASVVISLIAAAGLARILSPHVSTSPSSSYYNVHIELGEQRGYLYAGDSIAFDFPVTTGKLGYETPTGDFAVRLKVRNHKSSIYGKIVDPSTGAVIHTNVDARRYRGTSGGTFEGTAMNFFLEFAPSIGIHAGELHAEPASHGCVRVSDEVAQMLFANVSLGTRVSVVQ